MLAFALLTVAFAALLAPAPLTAARVRLLQCACYPSDCNGPQNNTCITEYMCYTQYVHGSLTPIAFGCIRRAHSSLLCEKWVHSQGMETVNSAVMCCDTDFCNRRATASTIPTSLEVGRVGNAAVDRDKLLSQIIADSKTTIKPEMADKLFPLDKPVVLSALFMGLIFLIAVLTFGFYLLRRQSRNVKRMCKNPNQGEMMLSLVNGAPSTS